MKQKTIKLILLMVGILTTSVTFALTDIAGCEALVGRWKGYVTTGSQSDHTSVEMMISNITQEKRGEYRVFGTLTWKNRNSVSFYHSMCYEKLNIFQKKGSVRLFEVDSQTNDDRFFLNFKTSYFNNNNNPSSFTIHIGDGAMDTMPIGGGEMRKF